METLYVRLGVLSKSEIAQVGMGASVGAGVRRRLKIQLNLGHGLITPGEVIKKLFKKFRPSI